MAPVQALPLAGLLVARVVQQVWVLALPLVGPQIALLIHRSQDPLLRGPGETIPIMRFRWRAQ